MSRDRAGGAAALLSVAVWLMPVARTDWGRAMRAELGALTSPVQRWRFALGCLRAAVGPAVLAALLGYAAIVGAAVALAGAVDASGLLRVELVVIGAAAPPVLWRVGRRDDPVGRVAADWAARVGRWTLFALLAGSIAMSAVTVAITMPAEGSDRTGAAGWLVPLAALFAVYTVGGYALTSAAVGLPPATVVTIIGGGLTGGLAWCVLLPFNQTWVVAGPRHWGYALALAAIVVGLPVAAAVVTARRSNGPGRIVAAGAGTAGLAALVMLIGGWATIRLFPQLLDSGLLDKGPDWRPPDIVEQVVLSGLFAIILAPLWGALLGALVAWAGNRPLWINRVASVATLAVLAALVYPVGNALVAGDATAFHQVGTTGVVFSPTGGTLLTSNADYTWILWNITDPARPTRLATFNAPAVFSPDGHTLASRNALWSLPDPRHLTRTALFDGDEPVGFAPDGQLLATHHGAETVLWNVSDRMRPVRLGTLPGGDDDAWFTADGRTLFTQNDDTIAVWDIADPTQPRRLSTLYGGGSGELAPDGRTFAVDGGGTITLWQVTTPARPARIGVLAAQGVSPAAFTPDGSILATGGGDGSVTLWRLATATAVVTLPPTPASPNNNVQLGASDTLTTIGFSHAGRMLSVVTGNSTASVWDVGDPGAPVRVRVVTRVTAGAGRLGFSPDGTTVAGAAVDASNSVSLWAL